MYSYNVKSHQNISESKINELSIIASNLGIFVML